MMIGSNLLIQNCYCKLDNFICLNELAKVIDIYVILNYEMVFTS